MKKIIINVTEDLHKQTKKAAHKCETTLSEFVREAIRAKIEETNR